MLQLPIYGSKGVSINQNYCLNVAVNSGYLQSGQKNISFGEIRPQKTICAMWELKNVFLALFAKTFFLLQLSILMICFFGNFSFSKVFLNIARYMVVALIGTSA